GSLGRLMGCGGRGLCGQGSLERLMLAVLDQDVQEVISLISRVLGPCTLGPWLLAHVTEVVGAFGPPAWQLLGRQLPGLGMAQEEHWLMQYALSLPPGADRISLAAPYLARCPGYGRRLLEAFVERLPVTGHERAALKALHICQRFNMQKQAHRVCRTFGALKWFTPTPTAPPPRPTPRPHPHGPTPTAPPPPPPPPVP
ncbi:hypothetical protein CYMTET_29715, partial [Cymbomonas tetramitiformis]